MESQDRNKTPDEAEQKSSDEATSDKASDPPSPQHPHITPNRSLLVCVSCDEDEGPEGLRRISCNCHYCRACLILFIESRMKDIFNWPPRCHRQIINEEDVIWIGADDLLERYHEVYRLQQNPSYCYEPRCSEPLVLGDAVEGSNAVACRKCARVTCMRCRTAHHPGRLECSPPELDPKLQEVVQKERWQKCSRCGRVFEKNGGCNHMK